MVATTGSPAAAAFDRAATRLMATILRVRQTDAAFPIRVRAALLAALNLLDEHPTLARVLTTSAGDDRELAARRNGWAQSFGALLRETARDQPGLALPHPFLEPQLIAGVCSSIAVALRGSVRPDLRALLPYLLEYLLAFYIDQDELKDVLDTCERSGAPRAVREE
jgi:hypothetical protein